MIGMVTKLKMPDFAVFILYELSLHSINQSVVIFGQEFKGALILGNPYRALARLTPQVQFV